MTQITEWKKPKEIQKAKDRMVEALAADISVSAALRYAGLTEKEFDDISRNDPDFYELCQNARGLVKLQAVINVARSVMDGKVSDSKWLLEHTTEEYSKKSNVKVDGVPIKVPIDEKVKQMEAFIAQFEVIEEKTIDE